MKKELPRLTAEMLKREESGGKSEGWLRLLTRGYLPEEIRIYAYPVITATDVVTAVRGLCRRRNLPLPVSCAPKITRKLQAPSVDWKQAFRSSVMKTGMNLYLSQPMIQFICAVADDVEWDRTGIERSAASMPDSFLVTTASLQKRGLIQIKPDAEERFRKGQRKEPYDNHWELTDAGRAIVDLLKCTGVFVEADRAIQRRVGE